MDRVNLTSALSDAEKSLAAENLSYKKPISPVEIGLSAHNNLLPSQVQRDIYRQKHAKLGEGGKFNRALRAVGHAFCWAMFGFCAPILSLALPLIYISPLSRESKKKLIRTAISKSCMFYLDTMKNLRLLTYSIHPEPIIKARGKLIIANHPSLLDAFFILGICPNLCCIAKEALWRNPYTALIVRMADYIHNGTDDFIEQAQKRLENGENILIFPEGTRNLYDDQLDFKRGAANIAVLAECDIVPIVIHCYPRAMQKGEKPYSIPPVAPHFAFTQLDTIKTQEHIDANAPKTRQYRQLTQFLVDFYRPLLSRGSNK